jgi:GMP synthase-like glutamine amidotransferase
MKPVAIFRSARTEGPGYFATYLERRSLSWRLVALDEQQAVPRGVREFSGLCFMGGPMSVNDDLPWIPPALDLIRSAVRHDVPVLGHCLGGQLMSKAFGGKVAANPAKEIGWGDVQVSDNAVAHEWLGDVQSFESFHWHGETFSIPPGATRVLENQVCANQGFTLGQHLGLQCHVEMTPELIGTWLRSGAQEIEESRASAAVQSPEEIQRDLERRVAALNEVANRIYDRWTENLAR